MVYSKFLKYSSSLLGRKFVNIKYSCNNLKPYVFETSIKASFSNSFLYVSSYPYSTVLCSRLFDHPKCTSNSYVLPQNSAASISTDGSNEKYQIIITNSQGSSSTLNSSLVSSANEIKNTEVVSTSTTDVTGVAESLPTELVSAAADVLEPSFASIGLAHWTPSGIVQMFLEYLHISLNCPWWLAIIACTVVARILLFPVLLKTQKNVLKMSNYMPQLQYMQSKFGDARRTGNSIEASRYASEMMIFMKEKNINPMKNALFPLLQAPVFLSFFFALRGMARAPVESMKFGGLSWVADLTLPDPYYILPVVACGTLFIILKVGAESGMKMDDMKLGKYFLQSLPFIALPFCINFPSAILYYWCTNNICTLAIVSTLKLKPVREYFNLPTQQPVDSKFILPKKGFISGMKEAYEDQKVLAAVEERRRMDEIRFQKAGTGPVPRTYSYDPTKPRPSNVASVVNKNIAAKERKV